MSVANTEVDLELMFTQKAKWAATKWSLIVWKGSQYSYNGQRHEILLISLGRILFGETSVWMYLNLYCTFRVTGNLAIVVFVQSRKCTLCHILSGCRLTLNEKIFACAHASLLSLI